MDKLPPGWPATNVMQDMRNHLAAAGLEAPEREAAALLDAVVDPLDRARGREISSAENGRLLDMARRRAAGEPVSRIVGWRDFWTHRFALDRSVLDPRPDSETLVRAALDHLPPTSCGTVWDMGCGSGCLLASILCERPHLFGIGIDISPAAQTVARSNLVRAEVWERAALVVSDWFSALAGRAELIVANPPYIESAGIAALPPEVSLFDPVIALDGGEDGLASFRTLAAGGRERLVDSGVLMVEVGAGQAESVASIFTSAGICDISSWRDLSGIVRVVAGRCRR